MLNFDNFRSGGAGRKRGVGKMNSRPALASCPVVNAKRSTTGVPPPNFVPRKAGRAAVIETFSNPAKNTVLLFQFCPQQKYKAKVFWQPAKELGELRF